MLLSKFIDKEMVLHSHSQGFWSIKLLLALLCLQITRSLFPPVRRIPKRLDLICRLQIYEAICLKGSTNIQISDIRLGLNDLTVA